MVILRVLVLIVLAFVSALCRGNYLCLVGFSCLWLTVVD